MKNFTPVESALGGVLIGLAAAMIWLVHGQGRSAHFVVCRGTWRTNQLDIACHWLILGGWACTNSTQPMAMTLTVLPALAGAGLLVGGNSHGKWMHQWSYVLD